MALGYLLPGCWGPWFHRHLDGSTFAHVTWSQACTRFAVATGFDPGGIRQSHSEGSRHSATTLDLRPITLRLPDTLRPQSRPFLHIWLAWTKAHTALRTDLHARHVPVLSANVFRHIRRIRDASGRSMSNPARWSMMLYARIWHAYTIAATVLIRSVSLPRARDSSSQTEFATRESRNHERTMFCDWSASSTSW